MTTFLKSLPRYDDESITDAQIERDEASVRAAILNHCVEVVAANIHFDKVAADENDEVSNDGLYLGTHHCVGGAIFPNGGDFVVELWADINPDDDEYGGTDFLFWKFGNPRIGFDPIGPIGFCPFCGLNLRALVKQAYD